MPLVFEGVRVIQAKLKSDDADGGHATRNYAMASAATRSVTNASITSPGLMSL